MATVPPPPPPPPSGPPPSKPNSSGAPAFLADIRAGARLKKVPESQRKDRSAPITSTRATAPSTPVSAGSTPVGGAGAPMGLGALFANGMPKLKSPGGRPVTDRGSPSPGQDTEIRRQPSAGRMAPPPPPPPAARRNADPPPPPAVNKPRVSLVSSFDGQPILPPAPTTSNKPRVSLVSSFDEQPIIPPPQQFNPSLPSHPSVHPGRPRTVHPPPPPPPPPPPALPSSVNGTSNASLVSLSAEFESRFRFLNAHDLPPPPKVYTGPRTYRTAATAEKTAAPRRPAPMAPTPGLVRGM